MAQPKTAQAKTQLQPRRFTPASFKSRRKRKRAEKHIARNRLAGSFTILGRSIMVIRNNWEIFGGLFVLFLFLNTLLTAGSLLQANLEGAKQELQVTAPEVGKLDTGLALFETLFSRSVGVATGIGGPYQTILIVLFSLAFVWALRQLSLGTKFRVRDALYNASYPLVQVLLVLLMMLVHMLPLVAAAFLVNVLLLGGVVFVGWQQALVGLLCLLLVAWSLYLLAASVFALYITTLPGMTPLKSLRSAKEIVKYRRAVILRKLFFLPLILLLVIASIAVPLAIFIPTVATIVFYLWAVACLPIVHAYMYTLYRELIQNPVTD